MGNHTARGQSSVPDDVQDTQNQNHVGTLSNRQQCANRVRAFPEDPLEELLNSLIRSLYAILNRTCLSYSFEELYRYAYTLVLHKHAEKLYNSIRQLMTTFVQDEVRETVIKSINNGFLSVLNSAWSDYIDSLTQIRQIVAYMERTFVSMNELTTIHDFGHQLFRDEIIAKPPINDCLKMTLLGTVARGRNKETIEWNDLRNACQMLITVGLENRTYYQTIFENRFIDDTIEFYQRAAQSFLAENSAEAYVNKANQCFIDEHDRVERYLNPITAQKVIKVLKSELIIKHMQTVVDMPNSGFVFMMCNNQIDSMRKMCELFRRVKDGTKPMVALMRKYFRDDAEEIIQHCKSVNDNASQQTAQIGPSTSSSEVGADNAGDIDAPAQIISPHQHIQNLLDIKKLFDRYLTQTEAFGGGKEFEVALKDDFAHFVNLNNSTPEFLWLYIEEKLRKGQKMLSESVWMGVLDEVIGLLKFVYDKDVFEGFYRKHLAKRLLLSKNYNDDEFAIEKAMISKLKTECGAQFTTKIEAMLRDIELANHMISAYNAHCESLPNCSTVESSVRVLSQNAWPFSCSSSSTTSCILPREIEQSFQHFQHFYTSKHAGRKIVLNEQIGSAEVKATFYGLTAKSQATESDQPEALGLDRLSLNPRGETKILRVTTHQMIILLRFNFHDQITFEEMAAETQIPERDLKRSLQSLAMSRPTQQVLLRQENGQEIVNDNFTSKLMRIKIHPVPMERSEAEQNQKREIEETQNMLDAERKYETEAAIVRVLKTRKTIQHNDLITEVTNQLSKRFMPNPTMIKKGIEALIEREYLKRDLDNCRQYSYIA